MDDVEWIVYTKHRRCNHSIYGTANCFQCGHSSNSLWRINNTCWKYTILRKRNLEHCNRSWRRCCCTDKPNINLYWNARNNLYFTVDYYQWIMYPKLKHSIDQV